MTRLAHEYIIVHGEIVLAELVPAESPELELAGPDVLPVPWRRVGVGAMLGTIAGTTTALLHSGIGAGAVFVTEAVIASMGLAILGSFIACMSSVATRG